MDFTKEAVNPNPRENANIFQSAFFTYTLDMFRKGFSKTLDVDDLYNPINADRSWGVGNRLERNWSKQVENAKKHSTKPSLLKALFFTFWPEYLLIGVYIIINDLIIRLVQPIMLGGLLDYFKPNSPVTKEEAFYYAAAMVVLNIIGVFFINQYIVGASQYGMRAKTATCALIYRKSLRLSRTALGETASGKVVNLLSNDISRFEIVSIILHHMWLAPTLALILMYILFDLTGYPGIVGMIPVFIIVPLQSYTGKLSAKYRKRTALKTDERIRLMDEIICGVQVIKLYAWEKTFAKLIRHARKLELKVIIKSAYVRGLFMTFNMFTTRVALFSTLITLALSGERITAARVFVFMSYYNLLSITLSMMFVRGISELAEFLVSVKRLEGFMLNDEYMESNSALAKNDNEIKNKTAVIFNNISAKWNVASSDKTLTDIDFTIARGSLFGVIGPVGCGKSSLLQTILGELDITDGNVILNGAISYAAQDAWVFSATIRQNIVFGQEYDKHRYSEVIRVCALETDFKQFSNGDLTIVGERGASLSGGQKARINLARAVYRDADIYLLDDPLSAVDIHVGKHLFEECIMGYLANKTRILVTHQVYHLKQADEIIILNNGAIEAKGTFEELNKSDVIYAKLLTIEAENPEEARLKKEAALEVAKMTRQTSVRSRSASITSALSEFSIADSVLKDLSDDEDEEQVNVKDIQEESSKGKVHGSLFLKWLSASGNIFVVLVVGLLFVCAQLAASGVDYFVSFWTNIEEFRGINTTYTINNKMLPDWSTNTCIYIYTGLIVSLFFIALSRSLLFFNLAVWCSQKLHDMLFKNIIAATMRFFDTNPSGRILNRFSKDIGGIDETLPKVVLDASQVMLQMTGSLILVTVVNPYFLILIGIISVFFLTIRMIYLRTSKDVKRLEGMMRSPVFTHLNATLQGITTIRAFGVQANLEREFDKYQDYNTGASFMYLSGSSAFGFYLDLLCLIFTGLVTFSFLFFSEALGFSGGEVGLAISQSIALTGMVQFGMRQSAEVANQMMSVERVLEYQTLPTEKQPQKPKIPPPQWPHEGKITFRNVGLRYDDKFPLVLKNVNFVINPNEKIGIVGRTGAGKSSLISALFRLALVEGVVEIDGIDCKDVELQLLRKKISIIPQDPVLFSGTLRYNLDPFEEFPDEVLWKALEEVELKDVTNTINRLESRVMDRGSNYSVGQRQLICLARAIIRNNKILMLDEATANVDPQTDAVIQKTIRKKFADCTVLTVAHRLNTIMDSDRVLVMEAGTVAEFDHPHKLLQNLRSRFSNMVAETGKAVADDLRKIARECYQQKSSVPE